MVLFAMLVFGLLAMAALTIDVGMANLAQAQMQTAVDTAALEGLKLRDFHEYRAISNEYRRPRVSNLVRMVFDDDMHPTQGVPPTLEDIVAGNPGIPPDDVDNGRFSVGPLVSLTDGLGASNASALINVPAPAQYGPSERHLDDPILQTNLRNVRNGDMVSGTYRDAALHHEIDDYERDDFDPALNAADGRLRLGFLVRMRRTNVTGGPDHVTGVSSGGPAVPFMFGLGSAMNSQVGSGYEPRFDGMTVRATAIAVARPALTVGAPPKNEDGTPVLDRRGRPIRGVGPITLSKAFWRDTLLYDPINVDVTANVPPGSGGLIRYGSQIIGRCILHGSSVGEEVVRNLTPFGGSDDPFASGPLLVYIPIFSSITDDFGFTHDRIIGFGFGDVTRIALHADGSAILTLRKLKGYNDQDGVYCNAIVAPDNASAHLSMSAPNLSQDEWDDVFEELVDLCYLPGPGGVKRYSYSCDDIQPATVFAPALAR